MRTLALCTLVLAATLCLPSQARADYQTDKDNGNLDSIDRALAKFQKNPAIFDGKSIPANVAANVITSHFQACDGGVKAYTRYFKNVSAKGQATPRARALTQRVQERQKWCAALAKVGDAYIKKINDARNVEAAAASEAKETCFKLSREVGPLMVGAHLHHTLDTWRGARTMGNVEGMTEFKGRVEKLATVCSRPEFKDSTKSCQNHGIMLSSETNQRYSYGDICGPALDVKKTMTDAAFRVLKELSRGHRKDPTMSSFKFQEGWIHEEKVVEYKTYFKVNDTLKQRLLTQAKEIFAAAGVAVPGDLSELWAEHQRYLDALKVVVDATVNDWKLTQGKCQGYACGLANKAVKKGYRGAALKSTLGGSWKIRKNGLGIPLDRSMPITAVFQVKGEPSCQARAFTATETYKGGGKYQKASGVNWGYARFQKCQ